MLLRLTHAGQSVSAKNECSQLCPALHKRYFRDMETQKGLREDYSFQVMMLSKTLTLIRLSQSVQIQQANKATVELRLGSV